MSYQLSWDLHVHPGPSSVPRWGTGREIQVAAARAGLKGFVWKSHEQHTARLCAGLTDKTPRAIGSVSLNQWAGLDDIAEALADGAKWVWGPTYVAGRVGWELALPDRWPEIAALLDGAASPLVLATGHLGKSGRRAFAEFAAHSPLLQCSITHSLYLEPAEAGELARRGAVFEIDLYTACHVTSGRPRPDLGAGIGRLLDLGATVYLTTDAGQRDTGDPYLFSARTLDALATTLDARTLDAIAVIAPAQLASRVLGEDAQ